MRTTQGLAYGMANAVRPGKTPLSSMSPCMVLRDGRPFLAIGAAGGPRIITGTLQGIVNAVDYGMTPERLVNLPYIHVITNAQGLEVEYGISEDTLKLLEARGHHLVRQHRGPGHEHHSQQRDESGRRLLRRRNRPGRRLRRCPSPRRQRRSGGSQSGDLTGPAAGSV